MTHRPIDPTRRHNGPSHPPRPRPTALGRMQRLLRAVPELDDNAGRVAVLKYVIRQAPRGRCARIPSDWRRNPFDRVGAQ